MYDRSWSASNIFSVVTLWTILIQCKSDTRFLLAATISYRRKRIFWRLCYLPTVDFVDKHSLEKVGYALLAIVRVGAVKTSCMFLFCVYKFLQCADFDRFLNTNLQDCDLHYNCNSIYVIPCLSLLILQYTSNGNSNGHHVYCTCCVHRFF